MKTTMTLGNVLDMVAKLPLEDKQECVEILQKKIVEERRSQIAAEIKEGREEFKAGKLKPITVDELMKEIAE